MSNNKVKKQEGDFRQLCVWEGVTIENEKELIDNMKEMFGVRIEFAEEVKTLPDKDSGGKPMEGTGDRNDLFFYIHTDDIMKFAVKRLSMGIRWWDDVLGNGGGVLYSKDILTKYPKTS